MTDETAPELAQLTQSRLALHSLASQDDVLKLLTESIIYRRELGAASSSPSEHHQKSPLSSIARLLTDLGCKAAIVQYPALDKEYQSEFKTFYSTTFLEYSRYSPRIHFFSRAVENIENALSFIDAVWDDWDRSQSPQQTNDYLGFVNLRPVQSCPIGRTVLAAPSSCRFLTVKDSFRSTLAGRTLRITGTPFMQQDGAVGACAHVALWTALRVRRKKDGRDAKTIADISAAAANSVVFGRLMPSEGLGINNILAILEGFGYHGSPISIKEASANTGTSSSREHFQWIKELIYPYIESGIPVIAVLKDGTQFSHSVVVVGHDWNDRAETTNAFTRNVPMDGNAEIGFYSPAAYIDNFFVQNDNTGPYQKIGQDSGPRRPGQDSESLELTSVTTIIPLLPKDIYVSAEEAQLAVKQVLKALFKAAIDTGIAAIGDLDRELVIRPFLTSRHEFRKWAIENTSDQMRDYYRQRHFPETIWVFELHHKRGYHQQGLSSPNPGHAPPMRVGEILIDPSGDMHDFPVLCAHLHFAWRGVENGLMLHAQQGNMSIFPLDALHGNYNMQRQEMWPDA